MKRGIQITIMVAMVFVISAFDVSSLYAEIEWYYDSPLTVYETITDIGGGDYRYEYSFENVDSSTIWEFAIYTSFATTSEDTFTDYPFWAGPSTVFLSDSYRDNNPEFDPINLDPGINYLMGSSYEYWFYGEDDGILFNDIATGFTFISSVYDTSPKYYLYDTIQSRQADGGTGKVAAVGTTVPEPATLLLFCVGSLCLRRRNRM